MKFRHRNPSRVYFLLSSLLFLVCVLIRYLYIFRVHPMENYIFSDMYAYNSRAYNLLNGLSGPYDSLHPPGMPLLIALDWLYFAGDYAFIKIIHLFAGVSTCFMAWKASEKWLGKECSLVVLLLLVFNFPLLSLSGFLLTETVFTFFLSLLFYFLASNPFPWTLKGGFLIGLFFGLGCWMKGTHALFLPLCAFWSIVWCVKNGDRNFSSMFSRMGKGWLGFALALLLTIGPLSLYHYKVNKIFTLISTIGGIAFCQCKCPEKQSIDVNGAMLMAPIYSQLGQTEKMIYERPFYDSGYFWKQGIKCIINDPKNMLISIHNLFYVIDGGVLWPTNMTIFSGFNHWYQKVYAVLLFPGILAGLLLLIKQRYQESFFPAVLCGTLFVTTIFFIGDVRYRTAFDILLIPVGVYGWRWLIGKIFDFENNSLIGLGMSVIWGLLVCAPLTYLIFTHAAWNSAENFRAVASSDAINMAFTGELPGDGINAGVVTFGKSFSMEFLVKPAETQVENACIASSHSILAPFSGVVLEKQAGSANTYLFTFGNGRRWVGVFDVLLEKDKWHYIVISRDHASFHLYVNGARKKSFYLNEPALNNNIPLRIGNWDKKDRPFAGMVKKFILSNRALSGREVSGKWEQEKFNLEP